MVTSAMTSCNKGLEKRLGLGLARSRSRSRGKNQTSRSRLGLVQLQEGLGLFSDQKVECLGLVSVS